jgi:hypothetical protein
MEEQNQGPGAASVPLEGDQVALAGQLKAVEEPPNAQKETAERPQGKPASRARPYFIPRGLALSQIPDEIQKGLFEIVQPCYEELVLGAATSLERQAGATLTFLLFLEILEQFDLGRLAENLGRPGGIGDNRDKQIDRYLRVVKSKQQVANFLSRLQDAKLLGHLRGG